MFRMMALIGLASLVAVGWSAHEAGAAKVDSALRLLEDLAPAGEKSALPWVKEAGSAAGVRVTVRFHDELSPAELEALEQQGFVPDRVAGRVAHVGAIYSGRMPWELVDTLAEREDVVRLESAWRPKVARPLNLSVPETRADQVWEQTDGQGLPLTGHGVVIADFDSGIDHYHPDFWRADGGEFPWLDTNGNHTADFGTDAVDINGNGTKDADETLRFFDGVLQDAYGDTYNNDGIFQCDVDWLYQDANNNSQRDFKTGFAESSPALGERLFIARDTNGNNRLDPGEKLVALGTSKVKAIRDAQGGVFTRGQNFLAAPGDPDGHGTGVCGVMAAQERGLRKYVGLAPDADLVMADLAGISQGTFTQFMMWARDQGARVMIHEIGIFTFEFLDGSSNYEQALDQYASQGIVQVVPAGNLAGGGKHAGTTLIGNTSLQQGITVPTGTHAPVQVFYATVLWRNTQNDLAFKLRHPGGSEVTLSGSGNWDSTNFAGHSVWSMREESARGTNRIDLYVQGGSPQSAANITTGNWTLIVTNNQSSTETLHFFSADAITTWSGGVVFSNNRSDEGTIDSPATADKAISVASYSTRGIGVGQGALSQFSARGKRIDGASILDIAAPGNYDIYTSASRDMLNGQQGRYWAFGGTSAAGPHVAAVCALLVQAKPSTTHDEIKTILRDTARQDVATGAVPNDLWGAGKMDARAALEALGVVDPREAGDVNNDQRIDARDAIMTLRHVGGLQSLPAGDQPYADMDGTPGIGVGDADAMLDRAVGK